MNDKQIQTALRLPESLLARVDELATHMSQPGMTVTRAEVLRLAAFRGVERLEAEKKKKR
jgi:predicted DNA-binding protein